MPPRLIPSSIKPTAAPKLLQLHNRNLNLPSRLHDLKLTMPAKATVSGTTVATTTDHEFVEGNVYFPPSSIENKDAVLKPSANGHTTWCPWKGTASYYDVHAPSGEVIENGAWYYPTPFEKAANIKDHVAFCTLPCNSVV